MGSAIYLDCFSGISGNMFLGALIDAGLPMSHLKAELAKLNLSGYEFVAEMVTKKGIRATYMDVKTTKWFQPSRNLHDILKILNGTGLSDQVMKNAKNTFCRLADAEAKVHGVPVEKIHFHEVGAVDAIVDVVGTMIGLEYLGVQRIMASALHVGSGYVKCSHGRMPVPAPATAELLLGRPFYSTDIVGELVTPTGAALVTTLAESFGPMPKSFQTKKVAYGAGTRENEIPNLLRLYVGEMVTEAVKNGTKIIETNLDDLNPQIYSYLMEKLFEIGVGDVYLTSVIMKKGRPGTKISVTVHDSKVEDVVNIILRETSSLGIKVFPCEAYHAEREIQTVSTLWGEVRLKIGKQNGKVINVAPEFEDCKAIAANSGIALKVVLAEVMRMAPGISYFA
jgi:uncharacterized protein (TIGR00299 family) protein